MDGTKIEDRYLGDGVYASFDGFQIWLATQQGARIAIEPEVFVELVKYQQHIKEALTPKG